MTGVLDEARIAFCCRSHGRGRSSCLGISFKLGVPASAYILLVVLHLVGRVGIRSPLCIQRDVFNDRVSIERPGTGQAFILIPAPKAVPGSGRSCRSQDFCSVLHPRQVGHRIASVLFKAYRVHISVIVQPQHQRPSGCNPSACHPGRVTGVLGEICVGLRRCICHCICGPCQILGFLQSVSACAHILLVVLHLVGRIGIGSPLRIQRDVPYDRISIERPSSG